MSQRETNTANREAGSVHQDHQALTCPGCGGPMRVFTRTGVTVDNCHSCHGFWLDKGELGTLISARSQSGLEPGQIREEIRWLLSRGWATTDEATLTCPHCRTDMRKVVFSSSEFQVTGDECPSCKGLWLDPGELGSVFVLVEHQSRSRRMAARWGLVIGVSLLTGLVVVGLLLLTSLF
jgi:Zn-finger nucleic acid-binding protein